MSGSELFYRIGHKRHDARLHELIIEGGDQQAAHSVGIAVARRLGLTEKEIAALYGPSAAQDKAWHEEDHPRGQPDNPGQFGPGGGSSEQPKPKTYVQRVQENMQRTGMTDTAAMQERREVNQLFPKIKDNFKLLTKADKSYNCIGWACGDTKRFWWPEEDSFWPRDVQREATVDAFDELFLDHLQGQETIDENFEDGYQKLALYTEGEHEPTHLARLMPDGTWTSKLGKDPIIEHKTLDEMDDGLYGRWEKIYKIRDDKWQTLKTMH